MKVYKANRKGFINYLLVGSVLFPIIIFLINSTIFMEEPLILIPLFLPLIFIFWIYFNTSYRIENKELFYCSGFLKGKIEILSIKEIKNGKTMWSGIKPALSTKGIIIKYNMYDEIYLAPENNNKLISDLLKINQDIIITQ